jgi:ribosomal protein L16 Arg81 hydroxylase
VQMGRNASPNYEIESTNFTRKILFKEFVHLVRSSGSTNDFYLTANNASHNRAALHELWNDIVYIPEYLRHDPTAGFLWMGPQGTITPFHHDLTNNFMAQVIGSKRLKIVPSWDMPLMKNHRHCFSQVDGRATPPAPSPPFEQPQVLECTLNAGEILFLPIGCMHFVEGLEISVTVSFTNFVFDNDFYSYYATYGAV